MSASLIYFISAFGGYLIGAVPFGLLLTKFAGHGDVRSIGSGNIGATNVLRTGSKKLAAATLILDGLKGTLPVLLANHLWGMEAGMIAGFSAFIGHIFPIWLKFKGGKGVATYLGVLFGMMWMGALSFIACWLFIAFITRISSLSALISCFAPALLAGLLGQPDLALYFLMLAAVIWFTHRENIRRILKGEESKITLSG